MDSSAVQVASFEEISKLTLYKVLELRAEIFNVEQAVADNDLDDRDLRAGTLQLWIEYEGLPIAVARTIKNSDGSITIGRVCTHREFRGRGLARQLVERALQMDTTVFTIHAQTYLQKWYEGFGFVAEGDEFDDGGIPHIAMRLSR